MNFVLGLAKKALLSIFVCTSLHAFSCTCKTETLQKEILEAELIFVGEPYCYDIVDSTNTQITYFVVDSLYKGDKRNYLIYSDISQAGNCGFTFETGEKYLVFAYKTFNYQTKEVELSTSYCTETGLVKKRSEIIRKLNKLKTYNVDFSNFEDVNSKKLYNEIWEGEKFYTTDESPFFPKGNGWMEYFIYERLNKCKIGKLTPQSRFDSILFEKGYFNNDRTWNIIDFEVSSTGKLSDFKVHLPLSTECDKEALRVLKLMPDWIPAKIDSIPVNSYHSITINHDRNLR